MQTFKWICLEGIEKFRQSEKEEDGEKKRFFAFKTRSKVENPLRIMSKGMGNRYYYHF